MTAPAGWVDLNRDIDQIRAFREITHGYEYVFGRLYGYIIL